MQLDEAFVSEKLRVSADEQRNDAFVTQMSSVASNCSLALTNAKNAVSTWTSIGLEYSIPYAANCSGRQRESVIALLGDDTSSRSSAYTQSVVYSQSSDSAVGRLADYTVAISAYNIEYVQNKTAALQQLSIDIVTGTAAPHLDISDGLVDPVRSALEQLIACGTFNETVVDCQYGQSVLEAYEQAQIVMNNRLRGIELTFDDYVEKFDDFSNAIRQAITAANEFYDSVAGAQGIIQWTKDFTGLSDLCGKSKPNWCDFSPVSGCHHMRACVLLIDCSEI